MDIWVNAIKNKNTPEQWKEFFKKEVIYNNIFVMLSHGDIVIPNFSPIIGHLIKIENFFNEDSEIFPCYLNCQNDIKHIPT